MKRKTSHTFGKKLFNSFAAFLVLLSVLPFPALNAAAEELPQLICV
ncbi:hypothetical protein MGI18_04275 [Bacillus sp. OVS6]|nr:hypothetical protein MGI18_04275 [Bacillus sp. OVS6]